MKKINFKQPKYILPLLVLPFLFLGYYLFGEFDKKKSTANTTTGADSIQIGFNSQVPGVAKKVEDEDIKNKFDAYREAYKKYDKLSPLAGIDPNNPYGNNEEASLSYSDEDLAAMKAKHTLDSLNRVLASQHGDLDRQMNAINKTKNANTNRNSNRHSDESSDQKAFLEELKRIGKDDNEPKRKEKEVDPYEQQMKMFREQMRFADSLEKAANGNDQGKNKNEQVLPKRNFDPRADSTFKPMAITENANYLKPSFNTIKSFSKSEAIEAIIDQDEKAFAGTRVRIRLLQDMYVGGHLIPKGTYLYSIVTGFQTSRINLSISQVFYKNETFPVSLDVFDNDGYLGLYVPGSTFREFTKEIGTQGTNGLSSVQLSDNSNALSGILSQLFRTSTTTAANLIKKEKAFVKYNYIVYLKENKQQ